MFSILVQVAVGSTEILAKQHYIVKLFKRILSVIVGASSYKDKKEFLKNFQKIKLI